MAAEKSGMWFLELILNILLLSGVAFVTFAARGEQERGLAVPLFAAVSPATTRPAVETPAPVAQNPASLPAVTVPSVDPKALGQSVGKAVGQASDTVKSQGTMTLQQAQGTLEIWAAGLDGKISADELKKIQDQVGQGWTGTQSVRDYLKSVNDKINAGQTDQMIQEALSTLAQQANDKKLLVMDSVANFMKSNGISWDQTQKVLGQWVTKVLHMSPADLWNSIKF
jgi:hypothetical protein